MQKTLCDWNKNEIDEKRDELQELVNPPRFFLPEMRSCGCFPRLALQATGIWEIAWQGWQDQDNMIEDV